LYLLFLAPYLNSFIENLQASNAFFVSFALFLPVGLASALATYLETG
jgi:hypothetical protein